MPSLTTLVRLAVALDCTSILTSGFIFDNSSRSRESPKAPSSCGGTIIIADAHSRHAKRGGAERLKISEPLRV